MINFVYTNYHGVHMYAKNSMCKIVYIFMNKYFIGWIIVILHDATMHNNIFG
jgi:hypothetical protein